MALKRSKGTRFASTAASMTSRVMQSEIFSLRIALSCRLRNRFWTKNWVEKLELLQLL